jgi:hypothetical protein
MLVAILSTKVKQAPRVDHLREIASEASKRYFRTFRKDSNVGQRTGVLPKLSVELSLRPGET